eukprot:PRCOL_00004360-RA
MESPTAHARAALLPSAEPYELRATLAYWTSVVWLEASVAFTAASFFMLFSDRWEAEKVTALVNAPFVMGAALFTVGAYVGILSALNAQHPPHTPLRLWPRPSELRVVPGLWGYFVYFVGTLWFLWNCIAGLVGVSGGRLGALEFIWAPGIMGGVSFVWGALIECDTNEVWGKLRGRVSGWCCISVALSLANLVGGVLFLWGSVGGAAVAPSDLLGQRLWVAGPFLVGSAAFIVRWNHFGFVHTSAVCSGLAMIDLLFTAQRQRSVTLHETIRNATGAAVVVMLAHGVLWLGVVVHRTPRVKPYGALVRYMRMLMVLLAFHLAFSVTADVLYDE